MEKHFAFLFLFISQILFSQPPTIQSLGFQHLQLKFQNDTVDILIKSKKGDEMIKKPIFLFIQGSQPIPLIIVTDSNKTYSTFPFKIDSLLQKYHVAIVSKPFIPIMMEENKLDKNMNYVDPKTQKHSENYRQRNYLDYYVSRNKAVLDFLHKQDWVSKQALVVAGHSEGSTVAAKLAMVSNSITHLIYLSGNPYGRIMSMIERSRSEENDSAQLAENEFNYWTDIVRSPTKTNNDGDTYKASYSFSVPPIDYLLKLKIPVLIIYGTKDFCSPFNDLLRVQTIREKRKNFTFKGYVGLEHNFFPIDKNGKVNYEIDGWDRVGKNIFNWLK